MRGGKRLDAARKFLEMLDKLEEGQNALWCAPGKTFKVERLARERDESTVTAIILDEWTQKEETDGSH